MLFKLEILIFFLSFWYILYYTWIKVYNAYFKVKKVVTKDKTISEVKKESTKVSINKWNKSDFIKETKKHLTEEEKNKISDIIKRVNLNSIKWYFDISKSLIIEGLSIDKSNKDLNLELANIYEKEKKYENAEYIYLDLLDIYKDDLEILKKLAYVYVLESKLHKAIESYEKIHKKNVWDDAVIEMLSEITFDVAYYEKAVNYTTMFLKTKPRNVEKLTIKAVSYEKLKKYDKAIKIHKTILELQPYNTFSRDKIRELESYI